MNIPMISISIEALLPFLRFARMIEIDRTYSYNNIVCYDARTLYVLSGEGQIKIDHHLYPLKAGCLLAWQAGQCYGFENIAVPLRVLMLNLDYRNEAPNASLAIPDPPERFRKEKIVQPYMLTECADRQGVLYLQSAFWAESLLSEILAEYNARRVFTEDVTRGMLIQLFGKLCRDLRTAPVRGESMAEELIAYIDTHISDPLSYASLGQRFNYHPNHINRMIRRITGLPFHRYLVSKRIKLACHLLCDEGFSVAETAKQCGYSDSASFSKCFKKQTGMSPSEVFKRGH